MVILQYNTYEVQEWEIIGNYSRPISMVTEKIVIK